MNHIIDFTRWSLNEDVSSGDIFNKVKTSFGEHFGQLHVVPNFETFQRDGEPVQHSILFGTSSGNSFSLNYAGDKLYSADFWFPDSKKPDATIYAEGSTLDEVLVKIKEVADKKIKEAASGPTVSSSPKPKKEETEYEYQDPKTVFIDLRKYINLVINGTQPSLMITGSPGVGKTHAVLKELSKAGLKRNVDYVHAKGKATAAGMYITLWEWNGKMIVFDDMDSIFGDDNAVNILKGALESTEVREISWIAAKGLKDSKGKDIPQRFDFTGKIIFITNKAQKDLPGAIKSRSFVFEVALSPKDMVSYIEDRITDIMPSERLSLKRSALAIIQKVASEVEEVQVNVRTLQKAVKIAKNVEDPVAVRRMIIQQCSYK
jgi:hypothetical protein